MFFSNFFRIFNFISTKNLIKLITKIKEDGIYKTVKLIIYTLRSNTISEKQYIKFINNINAITERERNLLEQSSTNLKFSIVLPVYNPIYDEFQSCLNSALNQTYTNYEIIIVNDCSSDKEINSFLEQIQNPKIKILNNLKNLGICLSLNRGVEEATGDYILFLDHDDMLDPTTLHWFGVFIIETFPSLLYSDEDIIDSFNIRSKPFFKPDWSPERLRRQNYINHALVLKSNIAKENQFRKEYEGSQDHDLLLSITENLDSSQIIHIPKVLYTWRINEKNKGSFSQKNEQRCRINALKAVEDHLQRLNIQALPRLQNPDHIKVSYVVDRNFEVSLIVPTRDKFYLLKNCIDSILSQTSWENYKIIIVDNDSKDFDTLQYFEKIKLNNRIQIFHFPFDFNFSSIVNFGIRQSNSDIICLLNNDIEVINGDWLYEMLSLAVQPNIGVVGAKLLYPNESIQHVGLVCGIGGVAGHSFRGRDANFYGGPGIPNTIVHEVLAVTGACCMFRKKIWEEVEGFNEENLKVAYNDVDFCLKIYERGYRNLFTPYATLYHLESASRGPEVGERKIAHDIEYNWMLENWPHILNKDPYYNKNLSLRNEQHELNLFG